MGLRPAAVGAGPSTERASLQIAEDPRPRFRAGVPGSVPPLSPVQQRPTEAPLRPRHRGQSRQPPRCAGLVLGVPPSEGQQPPRPVREGLLPLPSLEAEDRLPPGQRRPHGPGPFRCAGHLLLPDGNAARGQPHPVSRGHALAGRQDGRLQSRCGPARAEVPTAGPSGRGPRCLRMLPEGQAFSAPRGDSSDVRPARPVPRPEEGKAKLGFRCVRPAAPRRPAVGPGPSGANLP